SQSCVVDRWVSARLHDSDAANTAIAHDLETDDGGRGLCMGIQAVGVPVLGNTLANQLSVRAQSVIAQRRVGPDSHLAGSALRAVHRVRYRRLRSAVDLVLGRRLHV